MTIRLDRRCPIREREGKREGEKKGGKGERERERARKELLKKYNYSSICVC